MVVLKSSQCDPVLSYNYKIILLFLFLFLRNFISRNYDIVSRNYDLGVLVLGFKKISI